MNMQLLSFIVCIVSITAVALLYALYRRPKVKTPNNDELLQVLSHSSLGQIRWLRRLQRFLVFLMIGLSSLLAVQLLLPGSSGQSTFVSHDHIYVAVDNSLSMNTADFGSQDRLNGARQKVNEILDRTPGA